MLVGYIYLRDGENTKKLKRFEKSIEELNKEVYRLQKRFKETQNELENFKQDFKGQIYKDMHLEIKNTIDTNLFAQITPIKNKMETLQSQIQKTSEGLENKMLGLEERLKEFVYTPSNPTNIDENRIISMFKDGWSVDSIAKELRIGKGEVEFTLKFANLN
ncbi:hypothetical protein B6S12_02015 [Helicobacter valdiviensis]|uniref:Helix-turn-helix domain-containing protein n=1 Tax=Helicobacter valdiviensis TaxID=1458358 RepID=A0A2W6MXW4_9HELI|nr:hypothetical protein B6S12_02015 [Helicobacter valdiviensis]